MVDSDGPAPPPDDEEHAYLARYRPGDFELPSVAVDVVVFCVLDLTLQVLLIRRGAHPYRGAWALPGGFMRVDPDGGGEDLHEAAVRELAEETRLPAHTLRLHQLHSFGPARRDPRTSVLSVAHWGGLRPELAAFVRAGTDADEARWFPQARWAELDLAFDHDVILGLGLRRLQEEVTHGDAAFELVGETFTLGELRAVHELVGGARLDPANFRRQALAQQRAGHIEEVPGQRLTGARPARVYRRVAIPDPT